MTYDLRTQQSKQETESSTKVITNQEQWLQETIVDDF